MGNRQGAAAEPDPLGEPPDLTSVEGAEIDNPIEVEEHQAYHHKSDEQCTDSNNSKFFQQSIPPQVGRPPSVVRRPGAQYTPGMWRQRGVIVCLLSTRRAKNER